ncbi:MAG: ABC transporter ATP-binding protein [Rhodospirillaceae bacterium]|nr:ABC transporter ATP-binding protein [Rhodospirillaceae bacterium]
MAEHTSPLLPACVKNLTFTSEKGQTLIDDLSMDLKPNAISVIMGPNGAGKSLLLRLLHGLISPASGIIKWGGNPMNDAIRRRQAMVFQRPVMLRRSVAANIDFAIKLRGVTSHDQRQQALSAVDLANKADQPAKSLSGGEQQRLALARALITDPAILFLDEPTANLDPASTAAIEKIMRAAHEDGTKIVLVSHDLGQARRLAHEIIFMHRGRIIEQTPATQFFNAPVSKQANDFLAGRLVL